MVYPGVHSDVGGGYRPGEGSKPLGDVMNTHTALYHAWRFRSIRRKQQGDTAEAGRIGAQEQQFKASNASLDKELKETRRQEAEASRRLGYAQQRRSYFVQSQYGNARIREALKPYDDEVAQAQAEHTRARDALLRVQARQDTAPATGKLQGNLAIYNAQLLEDA